jgi:hypothetical protein
MSTELQQRREIRNLRKHLKNLSLNVTACLRAIDLEMHAPSTPERGKKIAIICNALDMANDQTRYFALGVDYRADKKSAPPRQPAPNL